MVSSSQSINKERGKRIKLCRRMTGLTAHQLAERMGIIGQQIGKWERGESPITEKTASQFVQTFLRENILCAIEWILEEKGSAPIYNKVNDNKSSSLTTGDDRGDIAPELALFSEIEFFRKNNKNALVQLIKNNTMAPILEVGDHVGGIMLATKDYCLGHRKMCIIKLSNDRIVVRNLQITKKKYILTALNPISANTISPFILETEPKFIAPIVFIRKLLNRSRQKADDELDELD